MTSNDFTSLDEKLSACQDFLPNGKATATQIVLNWHDALEAAKQPSAPDHHIILWVQSGSVAYNHYLGQLVELMATILAPDRQISAILSHQTVEIAQLDPQCQQAAAFLAKNGSITGQLIMING